LKFKIIDDHIQIEVRIHIVRDLFRFEKQLKDKLIQRSNSKLSEQACLVKMFKFFDIQNLGYVNFDGFVKVCEKTGMAFPKSILQQLFSEYDRDQSGTIDYRELAFMLYGEYVKPDAEPLRPVRDKDW
jgi:hypothetical protein